MAAKHVAQMTKHKSHEKGCVVKCNTKYGGRDSYREAGHNYIKANHSDTYNIDFTRGAPRKRLDKVGGESAHGLGAYRRLTDPRTVPAAWYLTTKSNFTIGYMPYNHDYHHMVPWDALNQVFKANELMLIQLATYNLNDGINLIILPKSAKVGRGMLLPTHTDNHSDYTEQIIAKLQQIRDSIREESETHRLNQENTGGIRSDIESIETTCWKKITAWGKADGAGADIGALKLTRS